MIKSNWFFPRTILKILFCQLHLKIFLEYWIILCIFRIRWWVTSSLEISQNSQENNCDRVSLLKNSLWHRCFPMNFATFLSCFCSPRVTFHHFFRAVYACRLFNQRSVSVYCIQNARDILVKLDHTFKFTIYNNIPIIKRKIGLFENWKREEKHPWTIQNSLH